MATSIFPPSTKHGKSLSGQTSRHKSRSAALQPPSNTSFIQEATWEGRTNSGPFMNNIKVLMNCWIIKSHHGHNYQKKNGNRLDYKGWTSRSFLSVELENNPSELMNHKNRHQGLYKVQQKRIIKVIFYTKMEKKKGKKNLCGKEKVDIMVPTNSWKWKTLFEK